MIGDAPTVDHLTTVISHAMAPAFLLAAVAGFLNILIARSERVMDMEREVNLQAEAGTSEPRAAALKKRVRILHAAIYFAVLSALMTATLLIVAFVTAFFGLQHQVGMAILFSVSLAMLMAALTQLARDVHMAITSLPRR